jgi:hypothetical protein
MLAPPVGDSLAASPRHRNSRAAAWKACLVFPPTPGAWINIGAVGQLYLIDGGQPSRLAKGPGQDPTSPQIALAVADIVEAKAGLEARGIKYWSVTGVNGPQAEQLFLRGPSGKMIELHQVDQCRCRLANRRCADAAKPWRPTAAGVVGLSHGA